MAEVVSADGIELFREEIAGEGRIMRNKSLSFGSSKKNNVSGVFSSPSSQFGGEHVNADDDDALHWAAIEKLPSYERMRASILKEYEYDEEGVKVINSRVVDVRHLRPLERHLLIEKLITDTEQDNEKFLRKLRNRIDRVGVELPTVEVRYQNLNVNAKSYIGGRALPTLWNVARNIWEGVLETMHLSPSKKTDFTILKDVNGILNPARLTLLLGPPGCGKTTLLLALAGMVDPKLKTRGHISYNGFQLNEFVPQKTSAYISQHDLHIAEMTVRETFDFSARCQGVGTRHELLLEIRKREKEAGILPEADIDTYMKATAIEGLKGSLQTDYILKILGLDICADTIIGDAMIRGISGGQRKRVTTGEMIVSPMKTFFMDEISTGLDSSTTFRIVKCLQQFAHIKQATIIMSLLQPAPETFDLFDDIIIMSEGQIVYHGPRDHVLEFFEFCGFMCPKRKGIADFLQEVTSRKDQEQYWENWEKMYRYISAEQFSQKFKQFHVGQKLTEELSKPFDKSEGHKAALSFSKYSLRKWELFKACFDREWLLMKRNSFVYVFKASQLVIVAFIAMSLFFQSHMQVDLEHGNYYLGALFFSVIFVMFIGFPELPMTIRRLPVFFKQRDLYLYPAWAYTLPGVLLKIPHSLFDSLIWTSITYYGIGYSPEAGRFFRQFLVFFATHQMATALFRAIAGVCQSIVVASTGGSMALVIVVVLDGFLIPRSSIPKWCRWGYWISPLTYAETAITVNEFLAPRWRKLTSENTSLGMEVLENRGLFHEDYFYWIGLASLIGFTVLFNLGYTLALTYLNPIGKPQAVISQEKLAKIQDSQEDTIFYLNAESKTMSSRHNLVSSTEGKSVAEVQLQDLTSASDRRESFCRTSNSSVLRGAKCGMILPFQPLAISFQNIQYSVHKPVEMKEQGVTDKRLHLLRDITGAFKPGVLTTLMGVSGAGKTTLMDVLAGRKTGGHIEGDIRISGFPKVQETFAQISGYCEQNDIHSPQVTVHESLLFSAWLRLAPEIDSTTKKHFVSEVMQLLELDDLKDVVVGIPGVSGLSTEQRKRLTIAVELVANPSIIFMDEPTSGLDARAAAIVMRAVRNIVDTGRTVVCTIHQPSVDIFEAFDELLLMKQGGQIIYAGPLGHHSKNVIEYFEAIPGVPKIEDKHNPATWILEVTSMAAEQRLSIDFAQIYKESTLFWKNTELVKELFIPAPDAKDLYFPADYAQHPWKQFTTCLWKQFWAYWRSPGYNFVRLSFSFLTALLFGTIYWQQGTKINDQGDLLKMVGAMYATMLFIGINNSSSVQPFVDVERPAFCREKAARMYSPIVYALAQVAVELPYTLFQTILYGVITYSMIGYYWSMDKFFWYLFVTICTFLSFTYYGMLTIAISPNAQVAAVIASAFYTLFNLFSGFLITRPQLPRWWVWYYWICPTAWTLNGLITSQYGDLRKKIRIDGKPEQAIEDFLKDYFGFHRDFLGAVAAVLVIFPVFFALLFSISMSRFNFQKR
jgi:ABC-type multidrug transport system ATPase subunit/ABC-type multidrug transport system permease subunit